MGNKNLETHQQVPKGGWNAPIKEAASMIQRFLLSNNKKSPQPLPAVGTLAAIPKDYLSIKKAGSGKFGEVFFCIPRSALKCYKNSAVEETKGQSTSLSQPISESLREHICVIKVLDSKNTLPRAWQEAALLEFIQASKSPIRYHIIHLINSNIKVDGWSTMTMEAIPGPTLKSLIKAYQQSIEYMPKELVWHLFLQLSEVLTFLRLEKIIHGDIHEGNIMMENRSTIRGFPHVLLIDFGKGFHQETVMRNPHVSDPLQFIEAEGPTEQGFEDCVYALETLHYIYTDGVIESQEGDPLEWRQFIEFISWPKPEQIAIEYYQNSKSLLDEVLGKFQVPAKLARARASQEALDSISKFLTLADDARVSDEEIHGAIVSELEKDSSLAKVYHSKRKR
jgi:serine/threonine protein kinase